MPKKTCPKCGVSWGVRKKVCDCGHDFSAAKHPLYPEPGAEVLDTWKDMPKLSPAPAIPKKGKLTKKEIRDQYVAYEGLGFCIHHHIPPEKIADTKLRNLWKKAKQALIDVVDEMEKP